MFIQDIYKLDESLETIYIEKYGQWDAIRGITIFEHSILKRRSNFHGHELK